MKPTAITCIAIIFSLSYASKVGARESRFYISDWHKPPFRVESISKGSTPTKRLENRKPKNSKEQSIFEEAAKIVLEEPVLALLLIDENDQILFEKYDDGASPQTILKGNSMTKSAVSVAVGQALCSGIIKSLDDKAGAYSKDLHGTAYGEATIRQLLMMASSGTRAANAGMPVNGMARELVTGGKRTVRSSFQEFGVRHQNPSVQGSFSYKGMDTNGLSIAVADATKQKFQTYFSSSVWQKIGAEKNALFQIDRNGDAAANSGMGATARDWGRLAIYIRNKTKESSCIGDFLRSATSPQISNRTNTGNRFSSYGFQFWTGHQIVQAKSAWLNGFDGQRIGIDLSGGKILVLLSSELGAIRRVDALFDRWTR